MKNSFTGAVLFGGLLLFMLPLSAGAQYAPPVGQSGTTAIHKDSSVFVNWASGCVVQRGLQNIADPAQGYASAGEAAMATGQAGTGGVVSLGDGGSATLTFPYPIKNGSGWDFAVFENSFDDTFLELAFVEVSSDGIHFFRFPSVSLTDTLVQTDGFGSTDATKIHNLAGKYRALYGTPFDLEELEGIAGLDIYSITHVRVIDVVGCMQDAYATRDADGRKVNDPWPTPFPSSGFDLAGVGVIHQDISTAIDSPEPFALTVYPNPVSRHAPIRVVLPAHFTGTYTVALYDLQGRMLRAERTEQSSFELIPEGIPPGVYLLQVLSRESRVTQKLVLTE